MIKHTNKQVHKKRVLLNIYKYINQSFVRNFQHVNETSFGTQLYLELSYTWNSAILGTELYLEDLKNLNQAKNGPGSR